MPWHRDGETTNAWSSCSKQAAVQRVWHVARWRGSERHVFTIWWRTLFLYQPLNGEDWCQEQEENLALRPLKHVSHACSWHNTGTFTHWSVYLHTCPHTHTHTHTHIQFKSDNILVSPWLSVLAGLLAPLTMNTTHTANPLPWQQWEETLSMFG